MENRAADLIPSLYVVFITEIFHEFMCFFVIPSSHCDSSLLYFVLAYEQCTSMLLVVISVHLVGIVHKFIFLYFRKSLTFRRWIDSL